MEKREGNRDREMGEIETVLLEQPGRQRRLERKLEHEFIISTVGTITAISTASGSGSLHVVPASHPHAAVAVTISEVSVDSKSMASPAFSRQDSNERIEF